MVHPRPSPPCPSAGGAARALRPAAVLPSYHPYQVELLAPFAEAPELAISFSEPTSGKVTSAVLLYLTPTLTLTLNPNPNPQP